MLHELVQELRSFRGLTRKSILKDMLKILGEGGYDDAGMLEVGGWKVVVSVDGITEAVVREEPWLAGYYSVVVNVGDVVAKGAHPVAYADIISSSSAETRRRIAEGVRFGLEKYGLKLLNGHTHPDTSYDAVDASVIGLAKNFLPSSTAKVRDELLVVIDLDGKFSCVGWVKVFDSVLRKEKTEVLSRLESIVKIAERDLANSATDISGAGVVGTAGLICELGKVGAEINLSAIPRPEGIGLKDWLTTYPSTGFLISTGRAEECVELLERHGFSVGRVGKTTEDRVVKLRYEEENEIFIDFAKESIFG